MLSRRSKGGEVKKFSLYVSALLALVAAGVADSAASPAAKLQSQDRVYGGGQFGPGCAAVCISNARNLALDAHAEGDGTGAVGNSTYGGTGGALEQRRSVTCVQVDGHHAVIGGIVESGSDAGFWYAQYFVDRGGPAAAAGSRDLASLSFEAEAGSTAWPAGFPYTCPSATAGFPGAEPTYLELDEGDLVVQDAPSD
jgi:hypothetical protein